MLKSDAGYICARRDFHQGSMNFVYIGNFDVVEMPSNVIYVGSKPLDNYYNIIIKTLNDYQTVELLVKGRVISRAVDALEVTRNKYLGGVEVKSIEIGTTRCAHYMETCAK